MIVVRSAFIIICFLIASLSVSWASVPLKERFSGRSGVSPGIWGSPASWDKFKPMLEAKGFNRVSAVSYKNDEAFTNTDTIFEVVGKIGKALDGLRSEKIAGRKVDVVAHSMGGLVTRALCNSNEMTDLNGKVMTLRELCREAIRKMITIDTPHRGSELADWLLLHERHPDDFYNLINTRLITEGEKELSVDQQETCDEQINAFINVNGETAFNLFPIGLHPIGGGVESLATGGISNLIPQGGWGTLSNVANEVPIHVGIGHLPDVLRFPPFMSSAVWWLQLQVLDKCGLPRRVVFDGDSDGIVSVESQSDGVGSYSTDFEDVDHINVTAKSKVIEDVQVLLDEGLNRFAPARQP